MIIEGIIAALAAGAVALAQQAGQSIQQWLNSPQGQKFINDVVQQLGQEALTRLMKKFNL